MASVVHESVEPEESPEVEALLREGRDEMRRPQTGRRLLADLLVGALFLAAAVPLALFLPGPGTWQTGPAIALVIAYALAVRARLEFGAGQTSPTLVVLVPMLFVLRPGYVPLLVCLGFFLADAPDVLKGRLHPRRTLTSLGNSLHAIGPAWVLAATNAGGPVWGDWPIYVVALAAQFAIDLVPATVVPWIASRTRPELQLAFLLRIWALDSLLAPVGLLAAFASIGAPYAWLLLAPLVAVLAQFASERAARLSHALELSESRAKLLEAEVSLARAREETLAAVSHGLQRPVASVVGLSALLDGAGLEGGRGAAARQLHADALDIRHRLRQGLDYIALRAGRALRVDLEDVDVRDVVHDAVAVATRAPELRLGEEPLVARTDRARLRQVVANLLLNALSAGPTVTVTAARDGDRIVLGIRDDGPGVPPEVLADPWSERPRSLGADEAAGPGIGLYVTGALVEALGAHATLRPGPDGGTEAVLVLPATVRVAAAGGASARAAS